MSRLIVLSLAFLGNTSADPSAPGASRLTRPGPDVDLRALVGKDKVGSGRRLYSGTGTAPGFPARATFLGNGNVADCENQGYHSFTEAECEQLANDSPGYSYFTETASNYPPGCYLFESEDFFWNHNATGAPESVSNPVCSAPTCAGCKPETPALRNDVKGVCTGHTYASCGGVYAGCNCGSVTIDTQTKADNYRDHGCAVVSSLTIQSAAVTDISGFTPLTHVCGTLTIQTTSLTTLDGLQNLRYIGGAATIHNGNAGSLTEAGVYLGMQNAWVFYMSGAAAYNPIWGLPSGTSSGTGSAVTRCPASTACPADAVPDPTALPLPAPTAAPVAFAGSQLAPDPTALPLPAPSALPTLFSTTPYEEMNCNGTLHRYDGRAACCADMDSGALDTFLNGLTADSIKDACNAKGYD